jgi:hypothetical protein
MAGSRNDSNDGAKLYYRFPDPDTGEPYRDKERYRLLGRESKDAGQHTEERGKKQDKAGSDTGLVKFVEKCNKCDKMILLPPLYW